VEGPEIVATQYDELGVVRVTKRFVQRVANVRIHAVTLLAVFPQSARMSLRVEGCGDDQLLVAGVRLDHQWSGKSSQHHFTVHQHLSRIGAEEYVEQKSTVGITRLDITLDPNRGIGDKKCLQE
jgi:hypothetical protein